MPGSFRILVAVMAVALFGCQSQRLLTLSDRDRAAIGQARDQALVAFNARDFTAYAGIYTEDAMVFPQDGPSVQGREAIVAFCRTFPPYTDYRHDTRELRGAGDLAYNLEGYSITILPPGRPAYRITGRVVWIWRKQEDGSWRVWREIYNHDSRVEPGSASRQQ